MYIALLMAGVSAVSAAVGVLQGETPTIDPNLAYAGVLVGGVIATLWPYYNATKRPDGAKWDWTYVASLAISVFLAMPTAIVALGWVIEAIPPAFAGYADDPWFVFAWGIAVGAFVDRAANELVVDKGRARRTP